MMRGPMLRIAAATAASLTGLLVAGLIPAQAAAAPGWRVSQTVGPKSGVTGPQPGGDGLPYSSFVATSRHDAWSLWNTCTPPQCSGKRAMLLEHWNGTTWSQRRPASLQKLSAPVALGASSASDVWIIGSRLTNNADLHWNGHAWSKHAVPSWVVRGDQAGDQVVSAAVFGSADVWVFSMSARSQAQLAGRYNGHRWVKVHLPAIPLSVSAVSRSDIWALGISPSAPGQRKLMHWNGRSWSSRTVRAGKLPAGSELSVSGVSATGPGGAWMLAEISNGTTSSHYLLHWNGTTWRRLSVPASATSPGDLAPDGHGGWWLLGTVVSGTATRLYFFHRSSPGHWTRDSAPLPAGAKPGTLAGLVHVPGTSSMLAAGQVQDGAAELGVLWRYRS